MCVCVCVYRDVYIAFHFDKSLSFLSCLMAIVFLFSILVHSTLVGGVSVTVIVVGNGISDPNSNPERSYLCLTLC